MMVRDILLQAKPPYLDKLVLLVAPIFNADGNEKINPNNRRQQPGPEQGVGVRTNGQNLDLNRDAIKLESLEVSGLVTNVLNRWDPLLLVDCHTTDGAWHEQTVTYSWPINPNGDHALIEFQRSKMMPEIEKIMKDKYKTLGPRLRRVPRRPGARKRLGDARSPAPLRHELHRHPQPPGHPRRKLRPRRLQDARRRQLRPPLRRSSITAIAHADELTKLIAEADARTVARGAGARPKRTSSASSSTSKLSPIRSPSSASRWNRRAGGAPSPPASVKPRQRERGIIRSPGRLECR